MRKHNIRLLIKSMKLNPIGPNQNAVTIDGNVIFFSYKTPVAAFFQGRYYRTAYKWSRTTSKHINRWLNGATAEEKPQEFFDSII